jgi:hypothetical protein
MGMRVTPSAPIVGRASYAGSTEAESQFKIARSTKPMLDAMVGVC